MTSPDQPEGDDTDETVTSPVAVVSSDALLLGIRSLILCVLAVMVLVSVVVGAAVIVLRDVTSEQERLNRVACSLARESGLKLPPECQPR